MTEIVLPEEWEFSSLETLLIHVIGGDWGQDCEFDGPDYIEVFCIRGAEFRHWEQYRGSTASLRKIKTTSLKTRQLEVGDILIEISGGGPDQPVGRTVLIDERVINQFGVKPVVCTNFLRLARPSRFINSMYLNCYLRSFYLSGEVINYQGGSNNLRNLKFKEYSQISIPVPSFAEQQQIAAKLDELLAQVDSIKTRLDAIPKILKRFRQSVLAAAVSGKLTEDWRKSKGIDTKEWNTAAVHEPYSHTVVSPKNWTQTTLGEVVDFVGGSQPPKSTFSDADGADYIRLIQIRDYKSDKHITYISKSLAKRFCSKTDVMIGRYGPPIFQILRGLEGAYNVALMKAVPKSVNLDLEYLFYYLKQDILLKYVEAGSDRTAGQDGVRKELLLPYPFFLPQIDEQTEVVCRVEQLFTYADQIEQRVKVAQARVNHLTQSILAKAFRGELTVNWRAQNTDLISGQNSAKMLLVKIKAERTTKQTGRKARG